MCLVFFSSDPVILHGEGEFNLNILKEVVVTDSFMGLDADVRECQNEEHYDDCTTRNYIDDMRQKCGCLPLSIRTSLFQVNDARRSILGSEGIDPSLPPGCNNSHSKKSETQFHCWSHLRVLVFCGQRFY